MYWLYLALPNVVPIPTAWVGEGHDEMQCANLSVFSVSLTIRGDGKSTSVSEIELQFDRFIPLFRNILLGTSQVWVPLTA